MPSLLSVVLRWCVLVYLQLCNEEGYSPAIAERRDMGLYEVSLSMSLFGFGIGTMLANFHMCGIMLVFLSYCTQITNTKCLTVSGLCAMLT